ncbi:MAG: site-specific integrase [Ignavibacteriae bacterium]|nr:MAG: site-specific integrase [Ignavibacteriota bacterium]
MKLYTSKDSETGIYYLYYLGADGKRKRTSLKTKDETEAKKRADAFMIKSPEEIRPTLQTLKEKVLNYAKNNHRLGTYELYCTTFMYLDKYFGNKNLDEFTFQDFENFKEYRLNYAKAATVNINIRIIKVSFKLAVKFNLLKINPAREVEKKKEVQNEIHIFEPDEFERLLEVIHFPAVRYLLYFGYYTGGRLTELLNLQWKDISLRDKTIRIINKDDFNTKTGKIRYIPIAEKLIEIINEMKMESPDDYLFKTSKNKKYGKDYTGELMRKYIEIAALPKYLHFHCLRHTFITNLLKKGVSIYFVKELAGHSNIATTQRYIHTDAEDYRKAVNMI